MRTRKLLLLVGLLAGMAGYAMSGADVDLDGSTVGILLADGFHVGETRAPIEYLGERGAEVIPFGVALGEVQSGGQVYTIARTVDDAGLLRDLDAVVIPGGSSPAELRRHESVLEFVRRFVETGKPMAAICHGPQVLISAGVLRDRRATCVTVAEREYFDVRDELLAAGGVYLDEPVVIDGNIITSRLPDDVSVFSAAVARALRAGMIPAPGPGGAWIGGFGHYLSGGTSDILLLNPEGRAFTVTLHRYNWVFEPGTAWNNPRLPVTVIGPKGKEVVKTEVVTHEDGADVEVPAAGRGVYRVLVQVGGLSYWHMRTTLAHAVATAGGGREFTTTPIVPRRWYFYVPEGTATFTLRTWGYRGRSQREDHGLTIRSPQGQRMGMLWDNPDPMVRDGEILWDGENLEQVLHIVVEPGTDGRFWSLDVEMGDAHIWSNFPLALEGVPPYLAPSPEQWFDPDAGRAPAPKRYEDTPYVRKALPEDAAERWPHFAHWMPASGHGRTDWMAAPALGDIASNHLRTPCRFALWNPEGRELVLHLVDYVPRRPAPGNNVADVRILDADGEVADAFTTPLGHGAPFRRTLAFKGVRKVEVGDIERFWAFTYPGTPVVLMGEAIGNDWHRLRLEAGAQRHWYFHVPSGTREFRVRMDTGNPADIAAVDINAPDRTVARLYGHRQTASVTVPPGLDGRIWHFAVAPGSATRYYPMAGRARNPVIPLDLDVREIPPYLAPTWEQWFNPESPGRALQDPAR